MTPDTVKAEHQFTSSWRWTESFEEWVTKLVDGHTISVCSGLSPVGDVRVDMMSPVDIIGLFKDDENTSLDDARDVLSGVLADEFIGRDVVQELYTADEPASHPLATHIDTEGFVRADVFGKDHLPFATNTFDWAVSDPPWKQLPVEDRDRLFDELVRITAPGGHILFNAWWVPTNESVTLDHIRFRQDNDRYVMGTPNVSYASVYTVHSSKHVARHCSATLPRSEFAPKPSSLQESVEAGIAYRLQVIEDVPSEQIHIDTVGPDPERRCPHCGHRQLSPVSSAAGYDVVGDEQLHECPACEFPVSEAELDEVAAGRIQQVRFEHGWSTLTQRDLQSASTFERIQNLREELVTEPGIDWNTVDNYLEFALDHPPEFEQAVKSPKHRQMLITS